jgi:site-specific DNA-methyltransferase (adenine-specific)
MRRDATGLGKRPWGTTTREAWDVGDLDWLTIANVDAVLTFWPSIRTHALLTAAVSAGYLHHRPVFMRKRDPMPTRADVTRWSVEPIWFLSKQSQQLRGGLDCFDASTPRLGRDTEATGHPYQKPVDVMVWLISKTSGALIDPFMGSGSTLDGARRLGRPCIGIEADECYCEIAAKRLEDPPLLAAVNATQADLFGEASA